ncbi:uncharacterized protein LOC111387097, partial [Olea europaea var. sylvestris]|uniref:uncharacterized protein LOC111387097 n=1 Tax=Olea europaea var. sylvestris TaxID=158386 RepID=UPI000C1D154D
IQIVGAVPSSVTYGATLHYKMVYVIQNNFLDFAIPQGIEDALLLQMDTKHVHSYTYVHRQIPRAIIAKLILESWITSYEQSHKSTNEFSPIQYTQHYFRKKSDRSVKIYFKKDQTSKRPQCFPTQFVFTESIPIYAFDSNEKPIYVKTDDFGHDFWDVYSCNSCLSTDFNAEPTSSRRRRSRKTQQ